MQEFFNCQSSALAGKEFGGLGHVFEELMRGFARLDSFGLLEKHARGLLVHDNVDAFKGGEGTLLGPLVSDT